MAQFLRVGCHAGRAGAAIAGLSAAQFIHRHHAVHAETKGQVARKDLEQSALWKNYTTKYGKKEDKQLFLYDVGHLLKDVGIESDVVVSRIFECMDDDNSGTVSTQEMITFCRKLGCGDRLAKMRFIFDACDLNSNGRIEAHDLRDFLKHMILNCHDKVPGYTMLNSEQDAKMFADLSTEMVALVKANRLTYELFKVADSDKNGEIDFKKFSFWFQRGDKTARNFAELFQLFDLLVKD